MLTPLVSSLTNPIPALVPAAWFQPGVGVTTSLWPDQSGNGRDMTLYNTPTVNADGSVTFDGVNQYGKTAAFTLNQPCTYYIVFKQITWTLSDNVVSGVGANCSIYQGATTPALTLYAGAGAAENTNLAVGSFGIAAAVFNGAGSVLQVNNTTATTGNTSTQNPGGLTLGADNSGAANYSNVQVKELIAFASAHSAAERSRVINWLNYVHHCY